MQYSAFLQHGLCGFALNSGSKQHSSKAIIAQFCSLLDMSGCKKRVARRGLRGATDDDCDERAPLAQLMASGFELPKNKAAARSTSSGQRSSSLACNYTDVNYPFLVV